MILLQCSSEIQKNRESHAQCKKVTIHQLTAMLSTSKNV